MEVALFVTERERERERGLKSAPSPAHNPPTLYPLKKPLACFSCCASAAAFLGYGAATLVAVLEGSQQRERVALVLKTHSKTTVEGSREGDVRERRRVSMCVIERERFFFFSTRMELLGRRLREAKRRGEALFINYTGSHTERANNLLPADEAGHLALPDVVESDNPDPVSWVLVLAVLDLGENLISGLASEHGELPHGPVPVLVESRAGEEELVGVGLLLAGELDAWSPSVADEVVDLPGDLLVGERGEVGKALVPLLRLEDLL